MCWHNASIIGNGFFESTPEPDKRAIIWRQDYFGNISHAPIQAYFASQSNVHKIQKNLKIQKIQNYAHKFNEIMMNTVHMYLNVNTYCSYET